MKEQKKKEAAAAAAAAVAATPTETSSGAMEVQETHEASIEMTDITQQEQLPATATTDRAPIIEPLPLSSSQHDPITALESIQKVDSAPTPHSPLPSEDGPMIRSSELPAPPV